MNKLKYLLLAVIIILSGSFSYSAEATKDKKAAAENYTTIINNWDYYDKEWKDQLRLRYALHPKLHGQLIDLIEDLQNNDEISLENHINKYKLIVNSRYIRVILQVKKKFDKKGFKELDEIGAKLVPDEKSLLGLVIDVQINNLRRLEDIKYIEFVRPVKRFDANYCDKIKSAFGSPDKTHLTENWVHPVINKEISIFRGRFNLKFISSVEKNTSYIEQLLTTYGCCMDKYIDFDWGRTYLVLYSRDEYSIEEMLNIWVHEPLIHSIEIAEAVRFD